MSNVIPITSARSRRPPRGTTVRAIPGFVVLDCGKRIPWDQAKALAHALETVAETARLMAEERGRRG